MFKLDNTKVPNGTVLMMGIRYAGEDPSDPDATRGRTNPKVYTYVLLKAGGLWYVTGSGKVPTAAGWGAINRWLERDGRAVEWVRVVTGWADLYPVTVEGQKSMGSFMDEEPQDDPSYYDLPHR